MPKEVLLSAVAADFECGAIEEWLKDVGDAVEVGDLLVAISTDKAVVELEAEFAGTLGKILVAAGTVDVKVNTPIGIMLLDGEDASTLDGWSGVSNEKSPGEARTDESSESAATVAAESPASGDKNPNANRHNRLYASPIARRTARKAGIDLHRIKGSGPRGRIVLGDVEAAAGEQSVDLQAPASAQSSTSAPPPAAELAELPLAGSYSVQPADNIRQIIARRLTAAKRDIPHFYLTIDLQLDRLSDARQQLNELAEPAEKVSVNDFFIKACALALKDVPDANAAWSGDAILIMNDINISVAVSSIKGLMTPVLRDADTKSLMTISNELKDLAERARAGKLRPDEFKGGGFTVSNLGMYGIREFSAIINPPQACILAIGAGEQRAVVCDGNVVVETVASCTLSVDHRAVDGVLGAEFLQALKKYIERPANLVT